MYCRNCGCEMEEDALFCPECGTKVEEVSDYMDTTEPDSSELLAESQNGNSSDTSFGEDETDVEQIKFCPKCGAENSVNAIRCASCGKIMDEDFEPEDDKYGSKKPKKTFEIKKIPAVKNSRQKIVVKRAAKKYGPAVLGVTVVVVVIAAIIILFGGKGKSKDHLFYSQDDALKQFVSNKTVEIEEDAAELYDISKNVRVSDDNKRVYYPVFNEDYTYELRYKPLKGKDAQSVKVDSNVTDYRILKNGYVIYLKDGNKLYIMDTKGEKNKIASGVVFYFISKNEKKVLFGIDDDDNGRKLYCADTDGKSEKIKLETVDGYVGQSDNFKKIYYTKNDSVYELVNFEEKNRIISDYDAWWDALYDEESDTTTFYYIADRERYNLSDYVIIDDCTSDPSYNYLRDTLRNNFNNGFLGDLYCYNGSGEPVCLAKNVAEDEICVSYEECVYSISNEEKLDKIKMSSIDTNSFDYTKITQKYKESLDVYAYVNGKICKVDIDSEEYDLYFINDFRTDKSKNVLYLQYKEYGADDYTLFKYDTHKDEAAAEIVNDDVHSFVVSEDKGVYYIKDLDKNGDGDLYHDDVLIESDVHDFQAHDGVKGVFYKTDYSEKRKESTINYFNGRKSIGVAEDVHYYWVRENGDAALLVNYSEKRNEGDLILFNGSKCTSVDDDVESVILFE